MRSNVEQPQKSTTHKGTQPGSDQNSIESLNTPSQQAAEGADLSRVRASTDRAHNVGAARIRLKLPAHHDAPTVQITRAINASRTICERARETQQEHAEPIESQRRLRAKNPQDDRWMALVAFPPSKGGAAGIRCIAPSAFLLLRCWRVCSDINRRSQQLIPRGTHVMAD